MCQWLLAHSQIVVSYVRCVVCAVCEIQSVLCAGLVCYVQCSYEPRRIAPSMPHFAPTGKVQQGHKRRAQGNAKYQFVCAGPPFIVSGHEANEKVQVVVTTFLITKETGHHHTGAEPPEDELRKRKRIHHNINSNRK